MVLNCNSPTVKTSLSDIKKVLFNKQYLEALEQANIPCEVESRNAHNIEVLMKHAENAIKACLEYLDSHAKKGGSGRRPDEHSGFPDEATIERWLMENLDDKSLGRKIMPPERQVRIDAGLIDILLRDKESGGLIVMEIKPGRAQPKDVEEQLHKYLSSPDIKKRARGMPVIGCLVAEVVDASVKRAVERSVIPVVAFEIKWHSPENVTLKRVAGSWPKSS